MSRPLILDASALIALFDAHDTVYRLWGRADRGELLLIVPAGAIVEANETLQTTESAWSVLLYPRDVIPTALSTSVAIEIATWAGTVGRRHVTYEALAVAGIVVTRNPDDYGDAVATLPI